MKKLARTHRNSELTAQEAQADDPEKQTQATPSSGPQGIGMAVAFDWAIAVQVLVTPLLPLLLTKLDLFKSLKLNASSSLNATSLLSLPFAALFILFGEGIRRGWRRVRPLQIGFNALISLGGFALLPRVWQGSKEGNYWTIVTVVILFVFSPLIAWRLSRPVTARWFATVSSAEARKRHGGSWPFLIALWAILGGVLQALATLLR